MVLILVQILNGVQFGVMLFLISAGLTLVLGIMSLVNMAHGSLFMIGAYAAATVAAHTGSFFAAIAAAVVAATAAGFFMESIFRTLYGKPHLNQLLATFGLVLIFNDVVSIIWGRPPLFMAIPKGLSGSIEIFPSVFYPAYRSAIILAGLLLSIVLYFCIQKTRIGMLIRAGATTPEMVSALGVNIRQLYTVVFCAGALLSGLAGALIGPLISVQIGMGENVLILAFATIIVGGIGSIRGALVGALLIGGADTLTRSFASDFLRAFLMPSTADNVGGVISSVVPYVIMAAVLLWRPQGLFSRV
jgi:branched-chain amino acid transport system permease protein